ncbi:MAG: hypothetical protein KJO79_06790, partial [Verrucomicrobiae bacterium]|nr:hypothetical protein [Verrucomicrobiae bacterium]NNJ86867.1 hypothetical protein [Akkermansiaceae bacterium]
YGDTDYGRNREGMADGLTHNRYIRYYWQGGLELSLMMLDHFAFTGDEQFARQTLLPLAVEIMTFFDQHWERRDGKIHFEPAMALETYNTAVNPLVEIVAIRKLGEELLALPKNLTTAEQRAQWQRLIGELPPVPTRQINGQTVLIPAETYSGKQNSENPELYAVFPYRRYCLGTPNLEIGRRTYANRAVKRTGGWSQDAIKAALLDLTDEARNMVVSNARSKHGPSRFPAFWGPNFDWVPDQCHGSVTMIALQRMLLQYDGDRIHLLPAWPKDWDVDFKLHAPMQTLIEGRFEGGKLMDLKVTPESRRKDLVIGRQSSQ